ncbi:hypothetical protein DPMN_148194 [Dreissena polymorpha]|uniref:Uncharacterized protein n=1 Tax=Dreissena polymorpha TaxID=45954 RepID=A0A9D4FF32_DREPO|nr:hypothetical protein DPMN_148194 [Dreissena polymorpha]
MKPRKQFLSDRFYEFAYDYNTRIPRAPAFRQIPRSTGSLLGYHRRRLPSVTARPIHASGRSDGLSQKDTGSAERYWLSLPRLEKSQNR